MFRIINGSLTLLILIFMTGCSFGTEMESTKTESSQTGQLENDNQRLELNLLDGVISPNQKVILVNGSAPGQWVDLESGARIFANEDGGILYEPSGLYDRLAPGESYTESFNFVLEDDQGNQGRFFASFIFYKDGQVSRPIPPVADNDTSTPPVDNTDNNTDSDTNPDNSPGDDGMDMGGDDGMAGGGMDHGDMGDDDGMAGGGMDHGDMGGDDGMAGGGMDHGDMGQSYQITAGTSRGNTVDQMGIGPIEHLDHHGSRHVCVVSHYSYNDPVVFPGQPGAAHLHMFWGNTSVNHNTTSENIRSNGNSTCRGGTVNLSSYWMPALFDENDDVKLPTSIFTYYKSWVVDRQSIRPIPLGLQMLAHRNVLNSYESYFRYSDHEGITLLVDFPDCIAVDGLGNPVLSSSGGTSHLAYSDSLRGCPASHPYLIPTMSVVVTYNANFNSNWYLSSDSSSATKGQSLHADYIAGWDEASMNQITQCVIDGRSECSFYGAGEFPERFAAIDGTPLYNEEFDLVPGVDDTPFEERFLKNLTEHMHH